ncbi:aminotransferase class III-fold pyridoxal phosphate-dependent enzyme [Aliiglaciecola sp. LCG003]|uniref:aminotransferase class III-fold pyridoxal phosphate-dependent enzyme n=1 Tax=Aliiglaciecola sp. LCG003 TaxID=3053655 RepID=UPI002572F146|nr:aminotransferase class III-fold pyridoxal phosphate-dependent enzyme [Aliiglaciecola sp. LCG003]WJG09610.1 aminotransferase class III-fold pyridoxal phosphate-dependent enzyme [Aliiglaciecola sp. LCG003]
MNQTYLLIAVALVVIVYLSKKIFIRLRLSRAKHPSLRGHSKWSRRIANFIPYFEYTDNLYFCSDGAPQDVAQKRRMGFASLEQSLLAANKSSLAISESLEQSVSDVRFTSRYRIPFPYSQHLGKAFKLGSIVEQSDGPRIKDKDGNWRFDLSGSYGVNVFGYDFYKSCMDVGFEKVKALGPALGSYHPLITENVQMIKQISGLDEVSFHMSGTEAVMQAVRLARYHTEKTHLVRFCGAYHGWWDGVQPGIGNRRKTNDVYTLADLSDASLHVLATRKDIACVLINPLQAFHPNADSASDSTLIASDRTTAFDKQNYIKWLRKIRQICSQRNIVLIFDEVFSGFRLSHRGAQGYFGIQADMVTYGKTLGGGLPVGVVCGRADLMKRFKDDKPVSVSFARGTFNSHPYVLGAMNEFLKRIQQADIQQQYQMAEGLWNARVERFNQRLAAQNLPLKITNMQSILSVLYTAPSRYNWMFQFYLRNAGIELSWTGTGRLIMSFNFTDGQFDQMIEVFIIAAKQMQQDGWWWQSSRLTNKAIKRQFLIDMLTAKFPILSPILPHPLCEKANIKRPPSTPLPRKDNVEKGG